jgi:hypothetical protein
MYSLNAWFSAMLEFQMVEVDFFLSIKAASPCWGAQCSHLCLIHRPGPHLQMRLSDRIQVGPWFTNVHAQVSDEIVVTINSFIHY